METSQGPSCLIGWLGHPQRGRICVGVLVIASLPGYLVAQTVQIELFYLMEHMLRTYYRVRMWLRGWVLGYGSFIRT